MFYTIKKYLSPFPKQKVIAFKGFSVYLSRIIGDLLGVYFLAKVAEYLEVGDTTSLYTLLGVYLIAVILLNIFYYIGRNWTWTDISPAYRKTLQSIYVPRFISLDTTYVEKIGTGKIISIIKEGTFQRAKSLEMIIRMGTRMGMTLMYLIITFWSVGIVYMLGFLFVLFLSIIFAYCCNKKVVSARAMRINASHGHTKQLVKIVMSKNEIMQSEKVNSEVINLNHYNDEYTKYSRLTNPWIHRFFFVPSILFELLRIGLYAYAGRVVLNSGGGVSEIVLLGGGLIYLNETIDTSLTFYKDLTRDFDYVKKMRDFFDEGETEIDYMVGDDFESRNSPRLATGCGDSRVVSCKEKRKEYKVGALLSTIYSYEETYKEIS